jgi:hypothetical protein
VVQGIRPFVDQLELWNDEHVMGNMEIKVCNT